MKEILMYVILGLAILWLGLVVVYFLVLLRCKILSLQRDKADTSETKEEVKEAKPQPSLVGQTQSLDLKEQLAELDKALPSKNSEVEEQDDEENEIDVPYTTEELDENEIELEEALLVDDKEAEVSSTGLVMKELAVLQQASTKSSLNAQEQTAVKQSLVKLRDSDFMDKYVEHLSQQDKVNRDLLRILRQQNEEEALEEDDNEASKEQEETDSSEQKPLAFYL